jgi:hypothetical protein
MAATISSGEPEASCRPSDRTRTRAARSASSTYEVANTTAAPAAAISAISSHSSTRLSGIDAGCGLVEDEQRRVVEQRHRQGELLAHAAGQPPARRSFDAFEPDSTQRGLDPRPAESSAAETVRPSGEREILGRGQVPIDAPVGRDVAEVPPVGPPDLARVGPDRPGERSQQRSTCRNRRPRRRRSCCLPEHRDLTPSSATRWPYRTTSPETPHKAFRPASAAEPPTDPSTGAKPLPVAVTCRSGAAGPVMRHLPSLLPQPSPEARSSGGRPIPQAQGPCGTAAPTDRRRASPGSQGRSSE